MPDDSPKKGEQPEAVQDRRSSAAERLHQVSGHVSGSQEYPKQQAASKPDATSRRRRRKKPESDLPDDYSDILSQVAWLRNRAATPDPTHRGYQRQKGAGKLWVRERVDRLLDPGTFAEVGSVSGEVEWKRAGPFTEEPVKYTPSNNVQGFGRINGRKVVFTADDFSLRAGHADGALQAKTVYMEKLSLSLRLPNLKLVDGSSGGGSVTTIRTEGWSYVPPLTGFDVVVAQLNAGIPNLGLILGPAVGLGAARATACHFSVMARSVGALLNAGPGVVAGATFEEGLSPRDLGGPDVHGTNGTVDNIAPDEEGCYAQAMTVLGFLPSSGFEVPPVVKEGEMDPVGREAPELRSVIPRRRERMYDARRIVRIVVDRGSWFEIGAGWGRTAIVGLARMGGRPVGVVALDPEVNAGALNASGSQKLTRHLRFCDIFNLPIVQLVDIPGYAVGTAAERSATMRHGVALATTYYATTIPIFSVLIRRVFGVAGAVMVDSRDPHARVAWPGGEWGSLPLEGGVEAGHAQELREMEKREGTQAKERRRMELTEEYRRLMNPVRTANAFGVEEIIDPAVTRRVIANWVEHVYEVLLPVRVQQRVAGVLKPVFV